MSGAERRTQLKLVPVPADISHPTHSPMILEGQCCPANGILWEFPRGCEREALFCYKCGPSRGVSELFSMSFDCWRLSLAFHLSGLSQVSSSLEPDPCLGKQATQAPPPTLSLCAGGEG